ncbi:MAG: HAD family hydrolase [Candidatus Cloacimonadota bacterium]|nr:HAD family hydrolase [Candidatus Cloacimonadota bacterium]
MKIELIIFDCDGVLVNSEPISNKVFAQMLNEIKIKIDEEETTQLFKGRSMESCRQIVNSEFNKNISDSFLKEFRRRTNKIFAKELEPISGIQDVLNEINYPICVASSGSYKKMEFTLTKTGLRKYFETNIFSASEVKRGKPYPDIFLFAAKKMGVNPENCIVIEDSYTGVQAGLKAGMKVLYFNPQNIEKIKSENVNTFYKMDNLLNLILQMKTNHQPD